MGINTVDNLRLLRSDLNRLIALEDNFSEYFESTLREYVREARTLKSQSRIAFLDLYLNVDNELDLLKSKGSSRSDTEFNQLMVLWKIIGPLNAVLKE